MTTTVAAPTAASSSNTKRSSFRYDIGGLRALAILIVVTGHLFERYGAIHWPNWLETLVTYTTHKLSLDPVNLGAIHIHGGVDMSFALSGYLITRQLITEFTKRGRIAIKPFYARRARRLLPAATLVTLTTLAATWAWISPLRLRTIALEALATSLPVPLLNYWFGYKKTDYFAADTVDMSPFKHYWSLNVEEQFYLVYPALLIAALVIGRKIGRLRLTVGVTLAAIVAGSLTWSIIQTGTNQPMAYFGAHTRAWELGLGALVAVAAPLFKRMHVAFARAFTWWGLAFVIYSIFVIESHPLPGVAVGGPVLGVLMVIAGGESQPRFGAESVLRFRPLQYIGKISYQWYLWHWPVVIFFPLIAGRKLSLTDLALVALVSFALAAATWHIIDVPLRKQKDFDENPGKALGMGVHLMAAALAASLTLLIIAPGSNAALPQPTPTNTAPAGSIERLVYEGTQLKQLPAPLKKALPGLPNDDPDACLTGGRTETFFYECWIGNEKGATKTAVLVGDSHAWQWVPAFRKMLEGRKDLRIKYYAKGGCTPEPYTYGDADRGNQRYTECEVWRDKVNADIATLKPYAVIVAATVFEGYRPEATTALINQYEKLRAKVVYIGSTPALDELPTDCAYQNADDIQRCGVTPAEGFKRPELHAAQQRAAQAAGAIYIDPRPWLCTDTACPVVINGMFVYFDTLHVSRTYVTWLAPKIREAAGSVILPKR